MQIRNTNNTPTYKWPQQKTNINFTASILRSDYNPNYFRDKKSNGIDPDSFVLDRLTSSRQPETTIVHDIGAGDGRNAIPIARRGFRVIASEINKFGRDLIQRKLIDEPIVGQGSIEIKSQNLFDLISSWQKADFVIMSHITQHFNTAELERAIKTASRFMNQGAELVFDALVRTDKDYKRYTVPHPDNVLPEVNNYDGSIMEIDGCASFWANEIKDAAQKANLDVVATEAYNEKIRPSYMKWNWGFGECAKPVKLTWFVLKKL